MFCDPFTSLYCRVHPGSAFPGPLLTPPRNRALRPLRRAKTISFNECATTYVDTHRAEWKNAKHASQWETTLADYCGPVFGSMPVSAVDTSLVLKVLQPIWTEKAETASRLRARIEKVLDWAAVRGYRAGDNPARWRGHLDQLLPKRQRLSRGHHAAMPYEELPAYLAAWDVDGELQGRVLPYRADVGAACLG